MPFFTGCNINLRCPHNVCKVSAKIPHRLFIILWHKYPANKAFFTCRVQLQPQLNPPEPAKQGLLEGVLGQIGVKFCSMLIGPQGEASHHTDMIHWTVLMRSPYPYSCKWSHSSHHYWQNLVHFDPMPYIQQVNHPPSYKQNKKTQHKWT